MSDSPLNLDRKTTTKVTDTRSGQSVIVPKQRGMDKTGDPRLTAQPSTGILGNVSEDDVLRFLEQRTSPSDKGALNPSVPIIGQSDDNVSEEEINNFLEGTTTPTTPTPTPTTPTTPTTTPTTEVDP